MALICVNLGGQIVRVVFIFDHRGWRYGRDFARRRCVGGGKVIMPADLRRLQNGELGRTGGGAG
jgi:hypothetical protein